MQKKKYEDFGFELIKKGTIEIIPEKELIEKLSDSFKNKKPLIVKVGFDPTAPDLHLGHLVLLRKMKLFQDLGHELYFLIGDFTGMIGDPTGRNVMRKALTLEEVNKNAETYKEQVFKILDPKKTKIIFNSKWCANLKFEEVLSLTARYTVAQLLERDDFSKRYKTGKSISLIEFIYPLVQGYDSVHLKADIELGGSDQKFNLLVGRELQTSFGLTPQVIITTPLLVGLDGEKKMSKSLDNYISINETPFQIFAKCMSISDDLMWDYFLLLTNFTEKEISNFKDDPFQSKKILAKNIVEQIYNEQEAEIAKLSWENEKSKNSRNTLVLPPSSEIPIYNVDNNVKEMYLVDLMVAAGVDKSKSAIRRLIESKSIYMGEKLELIDDINYKLNFEKNNLNNYIFKIGKKRYLKVIKKD